MRAAIELIRAERRLHLGDDLPIDLGGFSEPLYLGEPAEWHPEYTLATTSPEEMAERLSRHRRVGVSHLMVRFPSRSRDELCDQVTRFGTEVWPMVDASA